MMNELKNTVQKLLETGNIAGMVKFLKSLAAAGKEAENILDKLYYDGDKANAKGVIVLRDGIKSISAEEFKDCKDLQAIVLPESLTYIGEYAFYHCANLTSVKFPDSLTSIGSGAFRGCTNLTSLRFSRNLNAIYGSAFDNCPIKSIEYYVRTEPILEYYFGSDWEDFEKTILD